MATDTIVNNLIINKLTKAQYDAIVSPSDTELYLVPDEIDSTPTSASTNPVTSGGVYTSLSGKQDILVSGTNIKTVNNQSLLGSGNISIIVGTPVVTQTASSVTISPNCLNQWGEIATLTITLAIPSDATIVNEYMIEFESGSTATTLTLPNTVVWGDNCGAINVETNKIYQISIVNNLATWESWATA